jgi:hypothetical protein
VSEHRRHWNSAADQLEDELLRQHEPLQRGSARGGSPEVSRQPRTSVNTSTQLRGAMLVPSEPSRPPEVVLGIPSILRPHGFTSGGNEHME